MVHKGRARLERRMALKRQRRARRTAKCPASGGAPRATFSVTLGRISGRLLDRIDPHVEVPGRQVPRDHRRTHGRNLGPGPGARRRRPPAPAADCHADLLALAWGRPKRRLSKRSPAAIRGQMRRNADQTLKMELPKSVAPGAHRLVLVIEEAPLEAAPRKAGAPLRLTKLHLSGWPADSTFRREDIYGDTGR